jgi:hypothetical protein
MFKSSGPHVSIAPKGSPFDCADYTLKLKFTQDLTLLEHVIKASGNDNSLIDILHTSSYTQGTILGGGATSEMPELPDRTSR